MNLSQNNQIIKEINITKSASSILTQFLNKNMKIINEPKDLQNVQKLNLEIISRNFITDEFLKYLLHQPIQSKYLFYDEL